MIPHLLLRCLVAVTLAALLPACWRGDDDRLPTEPRFIDDVFGNVTTRWVGEQKGWSWSSAAAFGDLVITASGDQRLTARNRLTGGVVWSTQVTSVNGEAQIAGRNLLVRSGVVVAAVSRNTGGVDSATGQELWSYGAPTDTLIDPPGKPAAVELVYLDADDSTVYIPAWGASISAVDIRTGVARWVWRPAPGTQYRSGGNSVRMSGDTLLATVWHYLGPTNTSSEGWLITLDRRTGAELGRAVIPPYTIGNVFNGFPLVWKHLVIVAGPGGRLWAIRRWDHQIAWQYAPAQGTGGSFGGAALSGDIVYADGGDGHTIAVRASDGGIVWRTNTLNPTNADISVTSARVYIPAGVFLNVLDRATGRYVARTKQPAPPPDGSLFATAVTSSSNQLYVIVNRGVWCFDEP